MDQNSKVFSLKSSRKSSTKGFAGFLVFFLLMTSCGGSTGTDASGTSQGTDYGEKTVYDTNWRIVYYVEKDRVYTGSWSLAYHLEDTRVYDIDWRIVARIDGNRIYSDNWRLLYYLENDRLYDANWRLVYYIEDRQKR